MISLKSKNPAFSILEKKVDTEWMQWFSPGWFSKGFWSYEADSSLASLCCRGSSRRGGLDVQPPWSRGCDWGRAVCWLCFITLASFSRIWNSSKAAVKYTEKLFRLWKTPPGTSVHLSLQDSIKSFCNPPEEHVMCQLWAFSLVWRSTLHLCSAFSSKLWVIPVYPAIKLQFLQKENLSFLIPLSSKNICCKVSIKGVNSLSPSWQCLWC